MHRGLTNTCVISDDSDDFIAGHSDELVSSLLIQQLMVLI